MKKVLVIEDNLEIRENTAELLELSNYIVITADNGKVGIEKALANKPDLIICDIMMPELDGFGVLHIVQKNPDLAYTPFIFLSALAEQSEIRKGMSLGADDYIIKPFDSTDLLTTVESRLRKAEMIERKKIGGIAGINDLITESSSEKVLDDFIDGRTLDRYRKKEKIFNEGNHPIRLYYVHKGKVKLFKRNEDGKELIVKLIDEGEFFGYIALLEDSVYRDNAEALEYSEIISIPKSEFEALMDSNPYITKKFIKLLASDVAEKEEQLIKIAYNSVRRKVADAILFAFNRYNAQPGQYNIYLSRENLAAVAGTATESLSRTLTEFKTEKLIDIKEGKIAVINREKLEKLIN